MKRNVLLTSALVFGSLLTACAAHGYVVAGFGPPPPRYGVIGVAPGPGFVWTEGYYNWSGGSWIWIPGRWMRPPRSRAVWVSPEWRHEGRGYRFYRGYWR